MVKNMLSWLWKQEPHKSVTNVVVKEILNKNRNLNIFKFFERIDDKNNVNQYILFKKDIIPTCMVYDSKVYNIVWADDSLITKEFCICITNNYVTQVYIIGGHPNSNPDTGILCLPDYRYTTKFNYDYFYSLIEIMSTFYLDHAYRAPPKCLIKYEPRTILGIIRKLNNNKAKFFPSIV